LPKVVRAIRGAITVEENSSKCILEATKALLNDILEHNSLDADDLISIIFTMTRDLDAVFPARAAREMGIVDVALMCAQEIEVEGALRMCIRVLIHAYFDSGTTNGEIKHIYLERAKELRPDLFTS
jgi:monofunctional chorismate mutase, gram positive type, clade 1